MALHVLMSLARAQTIIIVNLMRAHFLLLLVDMFENISQNYIFSRIYHPHENWAVP